MKGPARSVAEQIARAVAPGGARPLFANGVWREPRFSRRQLAELRKTAQVTEPQLWESSGLEQLFAHAEKRPLRFKGHKHERGREMREKKIAEAMRNMDRLIAEHKETVRERVEKAKKLW